MSHHLRTRFGTIFAMVWISSILLSMFGGVAGAAVNPQCNGINGNAPTSLTVVAVDLNGGDLQIGDVVEATLTYDSTAAATGGTLLYCVDGGGPGNNYLFSAEVTPPPASGTQTFQWTYGTDVAAQPAGTSICSEGFLTGTQAPGGGSPAGQKKVGNCLTVYTPPTTGTITIEKNVTGAGASTSQTFGFSDNIPGHNVGSLSDSSGVQTYSSVAPGTYTVSENADPSADWDLTDLDCSGDSGATNLSSGDVATRTASINLQAGETIACVFENTYTAPRLQADVTVEKTGPTTAQTSSVISYLITARNNDNNTTATNVNVSDQLPPGTTFVSTPPTSANCAMGLGGAVECSLGDLAPGASESVTIQVNAPANVPAGGNITNIVDVTSDNDSNAANNRDTWDTDITAPVVPPCLRPNPPASCFPSDPRADLSITKTDAADPVTAGDDITYTITVTNNGPDSASAVTVTDTLPAGLGFVSATPSVGTCSGTSAIACSLGTLASGQSATITVVASTDATTPSSVTNSATAGSSTGDPNGGNNVDDETTTVVPPLAPQQGRIVVEKQTLPNRSNETFEFTGDLPATLGDGQTAVLDVDAGSYSVTEVAEDGWELTRLSCDDSDSRGDKATATATFEVAEGETVKCTFTNTEVEVLPIDPITRPDPDVDENPSVPNTPGPKVLPAVKPAVLPFTGSDPSGLVALASLLMLSGACIVLVGRSNEAAEVDEQQ